MGLRVVGIMSKINKLITSGSWLIIYDSVMVYFTVKSLSFVCFFAKNHDFISLNWVDHENGSWDQNKLHKLYHSYAVEINEMFRPTAFSPLLMHLKLIQLVNQIAFIEFSNQCEITTSVLTRNYYMKEVT